jgi:hypothetical protein
MHNTYPLNLARPNHENVNSHLKRIIFVWAVPLIYMWNYHPRAKFHLQPPRKIGASRSLPKLLICQFTFTPHATRKSRQSNNEEQRGKPQSPRHSCHIVLIRKGSKKLNENKCPARYSSLSQHWWVVHSQTRKKKQIAHQLKDGLILCAIALYLHDQSKDLASKEKPLSIQKACKTIEDKHWRQTGKDVAIAPSTVLQVAKGGQLKNVVNAEKGWLLETKATTVINFAVEMAVQGFPLTHQRLKEHIDCICWVCIGWRFPAKGVGIQWTNRFVIKHSEKLKMYWTHNLDGKQGCAVNPMTNQQWFDLLEEVLQGRRDHEFDVPPPLNIDSDDDSNGPPSLEDWTNHNANTDSNDDSDDDSDTGTSCRPGTEHWHNEGDDDEELPQQFEAIREENMYRTDKSGFFPEVGVRARIISGAGKKTQHQLSDSGRENTTVIVTTCVDGTALKPVVIFKGKVYQVKWDQNNPTKVLWVVLWACHCWFTLSVCC